jgi:nicotinate-nucleotide adenylyltransferase
MKVGLFGGSFDPIHRGHIAPVRAARRALGLDRVLYLPTAVPPHKRRQALAPPYARFAMVELALLAEDGLDASAHELTPGASAYTADTLDHFARELPGAELYLILGTDSFLDLPHWVRFEDIVAAARLAVLARPGFAIAPATLPPDLARLEVGDRVHYLEQEEEEASSTRLREILARQEPIPEGWLPGLVLDYIAKYRLYR